MTIKNIYLIETEELRTLIEKDEVTIIDTRDPSLFEESHIPGAINIPEMFTYLVVQENHGLEGLVQKFSSILRQKGLKRDDSVVIYEDALDNGYGQSCRGRFLLNYFGHQGSIRVLNGGFRAWRHLNYPLSSEKIDRSPSDYQIIVNTEEMLTAQDVLAGIDDPNVILLDCRDRAEWVGGSSSPYGVDYCPRRGYIPGAIWIEWYRMMVHETSIPWFAETDEILRVCESLEINKDTKVQIYCFKGARASNMLLAMKMAGIKDVRNYLGSWNEWSRDFDLPIVEY
ncbi:MAG: sulfurtransferase [Anaerolineaceae bacterium]|nr:sulfurtransferase [Anaerolineaceae bacterium]